ncbi:MAG: ATP-binding protein [bacterium]|nr:ATP-binding protein [bacterium]
MADGGQYIQDSLRMVSDDLFFDRKEGMESLLDMVMQAPELPAQSCAIIGPRRAGTSEIVKRLYKELFLDQDKILPLFYRFERSFHDPAHFAGDYLSQLIRQTIAFQEKDPSLLHPSMAGFRKVEKMVVNRSDSVLYELLEDYREALACADKTDLIRTALNAPERLADCSEGRACMILDHFHLIFEMDWETQVPLAQLYPGVMESQRAPHLFTGQVQVLQRCFLGLDRVAGRVRRIRLEGLGAQDAFECFLGFCSRFKIAVEPEAVQAELGRFCGIPYYMLAVVRRARRKGRAFTTAEAIRESYFEEVSKGDICFTFDALLNRCFGDPFDKRNAVRILNLSALATGATLRIEEVAKRLMLDLEKVQMITEALIGADLLEGNYGMVSRTADPVLADFLRIAQRRWLTRADKETIRKEIMTGGPHVPILTELVSEKIGREGKKDDKRISFGLVLPMVSETELVAARALEQVAERVDFTEEEIGKIRMALIEACINSFEHSGSQDGKIYITFTLDREKLSIVVEDKGVSFDPKKVPSPRRGRSQSDAARRGWGIELIKSLMDEVEFKDVPVGTKLKMVKYYPKETGLKKFRLNQEAV